MCAKIRQRESTRIVAIGDCTKRNYANFQPLILLLIGSFPDCLVDKTKQEDNNDGEGNIDDLPLCLSFFHFFGIEEAKSEVF